METEGSAQEFNPRGRADPCRTPAHRSGEAALLRQKRGHAIAESIANTLVGFAVSNVAWPWISIYLLHKPYRAAEGLSVITAFTLLSIARNYAVRRLFD